MEEEGEVEGGEVGAVKEEEGGVGARGGGHPWSSPSSESDRRTERVVVVVTLTSDPLFSRTLPGVPPRRSHCPESPCRPGSWEPSFRLLPTLLTLPSTIPSTPGEGVGRCGGGEERKRERPNGRGGGRGRRGSPGRFLFLQWKEWCLPNVGDSGTSGSRGRHHSNLHTLDLFHRCRISVLSPGSQECNPGTSPTLVCGGRGSGFHSTLSLLLRPRPLVPLLGVGVVQEGLE